MLFQAFPEIFPVDVFSILCFDLLYVMSRNGSRFKNAIWLVF